MRALVIIAWLAGSAAAEPRLHGFVTAGPGELRGSVVDVDGKPVGGARVHVGDAIVTTARDGSYRATLSAASSTVVYVDGDVRITGALAVGSEVVEIHEILPPAVAAKPKSRTDVILDYTDAASDADEWTRAWLLLDVSERGDVTQLKLLADPGHGLAPIAERAAFALRFEPALDRSHKPMRSTVLWTYEWPAYWWLLQNHYSMSRLPPQAEMEDCTGRRHRDCSEPDLTKLLTQPWVTPVTNR
ncbi:MAG: carboxypeptidase regulatory-like domain-containing protein [Deltaproteobacteria bacterium]|nr:carboxypeptidase regulatory-like domain-containing protein [Deltaproteobacteria bacterium]